MAKARNLSNLVSQGGILADGAIQYTEITGTPPIPAVLKCTSIQYPGDDLAANPAGGQTITLIGTGFEATPTVYVGGIVASSVSFISSTQITFTSPARTAGTYDVYVVNPGGATAIFVMGISYSGVPNWTTAAGSLGTVDANFTIQLQATSNSTVSYQLASGSTLPSGVTLSSSGLLTGTALTVEQTFSFSVVATDLENQDTARSFQVTVSLSDPLFEYVTLLLAGDTPIVPFNADASTNKFNLAISGDTKPNSFNPHTSGYYSIFQTDVSAQYINFSTSVGSAFEFTGDYTIETWVYTSLNTGDCSVYVTSNGSSYHALNIDATNYNIYLNSGSPTSSFAHGLSNNTWNHIAMVRSGSTVTLYTNGVSRGTLTSSATHGFANPSIARNGGGAVNAQNRFMSNLRVVKGTAVYTAAFTPSTAPLTAITNTQLLTCQGNRFIDASTNNFAITLTGSPSVQAFDPFVLPSNLQTLGSGYFDGSGDWLTTPNVSAFDLSSSSTEFTIEAWVYNTGAGTYRGIIGARQNSVTHGWCLYIHQNNTLYMGSIIVGNSYVDRQLSTTVIPGNTWTHIALVKTTSGYTAYVNGVAGSAVALTGGLDYQSAHPLVIGALGSQGEWPFLGYIANARIVKGTAVYTANFTPSSTTPLTAIANTSLLTLQTNQGANNTGFLDSSINSLPVTRLGNVAQGTFTPYGSNWSNYFDGSSHLSIPTNAAFSLGTGAFTVEAWAYIPTGNGSGGNRIVGLGVGASGSAPHYTAWGLQVATISSLYSTANVAWYRFDGNETVYTTNTSPFIVGQWNHLVVTRNSSNNLAIFVNGTRALSTTSSINYNAVNSDDLFIGRTTSGGGTANLTTGYISDVRVVKGTAVYDPTQTTITVPTAPLTAIANTSLLTCQSNRFRDNSTNNFTVTPNGSPTVQRFSPVNPTAAYSPATIGGSAYFDGSGDYLTIPANPALSFGTRDFTISTWIYTGVDSISPAGYSRSPFTLGNIIGYLRISQYHGGTTGAFRAFLAGTIICDGSTVKLSDNAWHNITIVRESGIIRHWIDGVYVGAVSYSSNITNTITNGIGADMNGPDASWNGYIANTYVNNGTALFTGTSNITVPNTPPTISNGNSLLLNFTNAGIIDSAMMYDLETIGGVQASTVTSKFGSGSVHFNGSNGMILLPYNDKLNFANNNFTIEMWLNPSTTNHQSACLFTQQHIAASNTPISITLFLNTGNFEGVGNGISYGVYGGSTNGGNWVFVKHNVANIPVSTWTHVALVRNGNTFTVYVNGVAVDSTVSSTSCSLGSTPYFIGKRWDDHGSYPYYNGYIDDFRITNGIARYTANFTPPTLAFKLK